jgi:hypothetical protein
MSGSPVDDLGPKGVSGRLWFIPSRFRGRKEGIGRKRVAVTLIQAVVKGAGRLVMALRWFRLPTSVRARIVTAWLVACMVFFCGLNYCVFVDTLYCSVTDTDRTWHLVEDRFTSTDLVAMFVPEYKVRDGKLYLKVQTTRPSMLLVTFVDFGDWDAEKVQKLRRNHPEFESYWPDRARHDGGVRWLRDLSPEEP